MQLFITGIGTDVGKTIASAVLTQGLRAEYWKPVQSGLLETDKGTMKNILGNDLLVHPSIYELKEPASPHYSAALEGISIELKDFITPKTENNLVVEGAGGLMVPLNQNDLLIDLIEKLNIPVVLVSKNYLGSINHTILSIEALKKRNIPLVGVLFNGEENKATESHIVHYCKVEHLGRIEHLDKIDFESIKSQQKNIRYEKITASR